MSKRFFNSANNLKNRRIKEKLDRKMKTAAKTAAIIREQTNENFAKEKAATEFSLKVNI